MTSNETASDSPAVPRAADNVHSEMTTEMGKAKAILWLIQQAETWGDREELTAIYAATDHLEKAIERAEEIYQHLKS